MNISNVLTITGIIVAIFLFHVQNVKNDLKESSSRKYFILRLNEPTYAKIYVETIKGILNKADKYFHSTNPFSFMVLGTSFSVALCLCFMLFIASWAIGGTGTLGSAQLMPQDTPKWIKLITLIGLPIILVSTVVFLKSFWRRAYIVPEVQTKLITRFGSLPEIHLLKLPPPLILICILLIFLQSFSISMALFPIRETPILAFSFPVFVSLFIISSWLPASASLETGVDMQLFKIGAVATLLIALIGLFGSCLMFFVREDQLPYTASIMLFCFPLPMALAISIYISSAIARLLGRNLILETGFLTFVIQIIFNSIAMVLCILIGIVTLIFCIDLIAGIYKLQRSFSVINSGDIITTIKNTPTTLIFTWLYGIVALAMIPIFLHFLAVISGLLTLITPKGFRSAVVQRISGAPSSAQLTLPAIYIATIPWISILCVILFGIFIKNFTVKIFTEETVRLLLVFATETHEFIMLFQKPLIAIIFFLILLKNIAIKCKNNKQKS